MHLEKIPNWIEGRAVHAQGRKCYLKRNPHNGQPIYEVDASGPEDVDRAVQVARNAQTSWSEVPAVQRGSFLHDLAAKLTEAESTLVERIALEAGRSRRDALGECKAAQAVGRFFSGEGQRLYGYTTTSATPGKHVMTVRKPMGIAGLIVAANTPLANLAWKTFPALICGNSVVIKAAEDAPGVAWIFAALAHEAGLPPGLVNVIQGTGAEAGAALVSNPSVDVISFTGSNATGVSILQAASARLTKVSLEMGGKNPLVVCEDADLDLAVHWTILSAFSLAGQRCASATRIIVFEEVYNLFRDKLLEATCRLRVGVGEEDDLGPLISENQLRRVTEGVLRGVKEGGRLLCGGHRMEDPGHIRGYYYAPTWMEEVHPDAWLSREEIFGPVSCLYKVRSDESALALANCSPFGLTACIHTQNINRAMNFAHKVEAGVSIVNAGTFGSEPHLPFGGFKQSGNGTREPGREALDVYSQWKNIYLNISTDF